MVMQFFIGFNLTSDLKNHLLMSQHWRADQETHQKNLLMIQNEKKEYVGRFLNMQNPSIQDLTAEGCTVSKWVEFYCPDLRSNKLSLIIFPQFFIG